MLSCCDSSSLRVLVVDDHELTRLSLKFALSSQKNIELVGLASNGQEAIRMVENHRPDVIILDLQMPVMDGWSASRYIKSMYPQAQIIAYSAVEEQQATATNPKPSVDAFCSKETATHELIELVKELGNRNGSGT
ncbi:response regulator transcription factor [Planktothrix sp. FACHB-1355]|uniref:Response regulator transcription factor n=2 Tax=Cyanophyceae TaxID=3028117 RepID=A0A926ZL88_9CYAN|nr:response regulator transcription factor [Aerosakkonema funiforme FACHB-1375]MBD3561062.1 response regulator transcription factor [Planktothrix sp. FACHB-1355]